MGGYEEPKSVSLDMMSVSGAHPTLSRNLKECYYRGLNTYQYYSRGSLL